MTKREFFVTVSESDLPDEVTAMARNMLESLDKSNAKRAAKANSKKAEIQQPIINAAKAFLAEHPKTLSTDLATAISEELGEVVTVQRVCGILLHSDDFEGEYISVKGKGKQKAWSLVADDDCDDCDESDD